MDDLDGFLIRSAQAEELLRSLLPDGDLADVPEHQLIHYAFGAVVRFVRLGGAVVAALEGAEGDVLTADDPTDGDATLRHDGEHYVAPTAHGAAARFLCRAWETATLIPDPSGPADAPYPLTVNPLETGVAAGPAWEIAEADAERMVETPGSRAGGLAYYRFADDEVNGVRAVLSRMRRERLRLKSPRQSEPVPPPAPPPPPPNLSDDDLAEMDRWFDRAGSVVADFAETVGMLEGFAEAPDYRHTVWLYLCHYGVDRYLPPKPGADDLIDFGEWREPLVIAARGGSVNEYPLPNAGFTGRTATGTVVHLANIIARRLNWFSDWKHQQSPAPERDAELSQRLRAAVRDLAPWRERSLLKLADDIAGERAVTIGYIEGPAEYGPVSRQDAAELFSVSVRTILNWADGSITAGEGSAAVRGVGKPLKMMIDPRELSADVAALFPAWRDGVERTAAQRAARRKRARS